MGLVEAAALHALAAGQREAAYDLAERSLYESLMTHGRQGTVLEWLARLPADELDRRPRLLLAAAWSLALSERHEEANRLVERILPGPAVDPALRCECALILSGAAVYADDPDRFAELHDPWAQEAPIGDAPLEDPLLLQVHANRSAFRTLLDGEPALARLRQQQAPRGGQGAAYGYLDRWGDFIVGLTYLWEGQVLLAEKLLRPTLARAEGDLGRRSPFACMLAALLAAAVWERDQPEEAAALLANRLDVLERSGLPEAVLLGFRTMARIAGAEGAEHRALELLGALDAVGVARRLPRLRIASLADQVRLHAHRFRAETCRDLCVQIDALLADPEAPQGPLWRRSVGPAARGGAGPRGDRGPGLAPRRRVAGAGRRRRPGLQAGPAAHRAARPARLGRSTAAARSRCPCCARRSTWRGTYGLLRVFDDAHPALGDWVREALPGRRARRPAGRDRSRPRRARRRRRPPPPQGPRHAEHGAHAQGARGAGAAGAQPVEQGDRPGHAGGRRNHQVAHEEPVRQAGRGHAQAGRRSAPASWGCSKPRPEAGSPPSATGGSEAPRIPNLASRKGRTQRPLETSP